MSSKYFQVIALILCCSGLLQLPSNAAELLLPKVYSDQVDVSGWLMSEKLDGVRGYWDGKQMLSKNGNILYAPKAFVKDFPPFALEGEIWGGHNTYEKTSGTVKKQRPHNGWFELKFGIFDVPEAPGGFTERIAQAEKWFSTHPSTYAFVIEQSTVLDHKHLQKQLSHIEKLGGEGLIVRKPHALYTAGRSTEILKVKNFQDAEAQVIGHLPGKGKNTGRLGSLLVQLNGGIQFKLGSGFTDAERESPPPIGAIVTFKFYGKYQSGIPKFPSFLRIRQDQKL